MSLRMKSRASRRAVFKCPRKTAQNDSKFTIKQEDLEISNLRDELLTNPNLENLPFDKLLKLKINLEQFKKDCLKTRQYAKAKEAVDLDDLLTSEIERQSKELEDYNSKRRCEEAMSRARNREYVIYDSFFFKMNHFYMN